MSTQRHRTAVFALAILVAALPILACAAAPQDSPLAPTDSVMAAWNQCATLGVAPFGGRGGASSGLLGAAWDATLAHEHASLLSHAFWLASRRICASRPPLAFLRRLVI
ncbi:MAG TPA: hypothetical protein P5137_05265 [Candidatus Brocadiia bacterium]|nr:hypothetical protein [Candidatus Brocadiia bacterium]